MTIKQLKEELDKLPEDLEIYFHEMSKNPLTSFSKVRQIEGRGYPFYRKDSIAIIIADD